VLGAEGALAHGKEYEHDVTNDDSRASSVRLAAVSCRSATFIEPSRV
jgi:hypothetical protein